jgi:UDP-3-O-[3-hydroxymyristoyl] N-acetylglucosamine deacetylase
MRLFVCKREHPNPCQLETEQTIRSSVECNGLACTAEHRALALVAGVSGIRDLFAVPGLDDSVETLDNVARQLRHEPDEKGVLISTTEHLLSALIGCGIDNAVVELDNLELPILDGSAKPFVELIRNARTQAAPAAHLSANPQGAGITRGDKFIAAGGYVFGAVHDQFSSSADR